jgi:hypothetical protein
VELTLMVCARHSAPGWSAVVQPVCIGIPVVSWMPAVLRSISERQHGDRRKEATMKVFLSWSGNVSHAVASALRKWLPYMHHSIRPFISSDDISKGDRWTGALSRELKDSQYGIICVTPYNAHKPWMNFEAGALANFMGTSKVMPLLFQVDRTELEDGPLAQFQTTDATKAEFYSLISTLNSSLAPESQLEHDVLRDNFGRWWDELDKDLQKIQRHSPGETRTAYKWLLTYEDLAIHTPKADCTQIWFVTADLFEYAVREGAKHEILNNLDKVKYRFLVRKPSGDDERRWMNDLEKLRKDHEPRLDYRCYRRRDFEREAASDYVIVESIGCRNPLKVYVRIPIADGGREYWFDTDERAAHSFYERFSDLWNRPEAVTPEQIKRELDEGSGALDPIAMEVGGP